MVTTHDAEAARDARDVRTALFVDFDNIFISLRETGSAEAADAFKQQPSQWVRWLEMPRDGQRRRVLIRRCYLNPKAFGDARRGFVNAGFEVVDCPVTTMTGKTSADVFMVIDILDALNHSTHFDEFVIMSADTDFRPVALRLRKHDRRTTVLIVGQASEAYKGSVDAIIDEIGFLENALHADQCVARSVQELSAGQRATIIADVKRRVEACVGRSTEPVPLADIGNQLFQEMPQSLREHNYAGYGSLGTLIESMNGERLQVAYVGTGFVLDPTRHDAPDEDAIERHSKLAQEHPDIAAFYRRLHLPGLPTLSPEDYRVLFDTLAAEIEANGYSRTETSKAVRDYCQSEGHGVSRKDVNFVLTGLHYQGYNLQKEMHNPATMVAAFRMNVERFCEYNDIEVTKDIYALLERAIPAQ